MDTYTRRAHSAGDPPYLDVPGRQRLVTVRSRTGLTIDAVALAFGVHPERLADMEAGWEPIPPFLLTGWCRFLESHDGWNEDAA